jgi:glycosyltransferase involved in cell wall biosynthesis
VVQAPESRTVHTQAEGSFKEVFILTTESPERSGGVETFIRCVNTLLIAHGYRVRVFHRGNCVPPSWRWADRNGRWSRLMIDVLLGYWEGKAVRGALHQDVRLVLSNATVGWFPIPDVNRAHFYHGTYRGQAEEIRSLISRKGYLKLKWWDAMLLERFSGRCKSCLVNSDQTLEEIGCFFGYPGRTVGCPLDTNVFRPMDRALARRDLGFDPETAMGLFVGTTEPNKGLAVVECLIERFPEVQWVLALGGGSSFTRSHSHVRVMRDSSAEKLSLLYNAAHFTLSTSRYEPFGYVVAESLACGTPVIATKGGASRQFLCGTRLTRFLISDADDIAAFAGAVRGLLEDPQLYRDAALAEVRPRVIKLMEPDAWWIRFLRETGLDD